MAIQLNADDNFLILSAVGSPETANKVIALLNLAGTGNMSGPVSSTDKALPRFNGTTGALLQNSGVLVSDSNAVSGVASLNGVSAATIAFLDATSSIQTQINSKLSSSGGSVSGPLLEANGLVSAPAYSFSAETNSGLYRAGAADLRLAISGVDKVQVTSGTFNITVPLQTNAGAAPGPSHSFTGDPDTGMYSRSANEIGIATNGADRMIIQVGQVIGTVPFAAQLGSVSAPSYIYDGDSNTGVYSPGADQLALATGGVNAIVISSSQAVTLGTGSGATHRLNSSVQAPAAGVLTLTNGPGASTGNPAVYLTLNINGTNYVVPAWAF